MTKIEEMSKQTLLDLLTEERLTKAFEEVAKEIPLENGKFVRFTPEYHVAVNDACCYEFETKEPLSLAADMKWKGPFAEDFFMSSLKQNISIGIVNEQTGDIMAARVIKLKKLVEDLPHLSDIQDEGFRKMYDFLAFCDQEAMYSKHFDTNEVFHFRGLIVPGRYTRQGLATKVMEFSVKFLKHLNLGEIFIKGETTSPYSRTIYENLGFKRLFGIAFEDYKVNGEQVLKTFDEPRGMNVYGMQLE